MNTVKNFQAQIRMKAGEAVIIDVREPAEYWDGHISGAINIPSTCYQKDQYAEFSQKQIYLICESGSRASQIATKLQGDGFEDIYLLSQQMAEIPQNAISQTWTIDRQFRMTLGIFIAIYLLLQFIGVNEGIIIPMILCTGLIITSLIDRCYLRIGIARMPWNQKKARIY